jgi:hypothetical protein
LASILCNLGATALIKTRQIEQTIRDRGMERGMIYLFEMQQEQIKQIDGSVRQMAALLDKMIDTLNNTVQGAAAVKQDLINTLGKAGITVGSEPADDGLDPNTQSL